MKKSKKISSKMTAIMIKLKTHEVPASSRNHSIILCKQNAINKTALEGKANGTGACRHLHYSESLGYGL
jgi:hypothetical protein